MIKEYERIKRRQNPPYRTVEDLKQEERTGKSTGCVRCRLMAIELSEGTEDSQKIYNYVVERCPHIKIKKRAVRRSKNKRTGNGGGR